MDENFSRLRALVTVAENRSVAGAARKLNLSQPAVTKSIRTLESKLGLTLFDRTPDGMIPTVYGETLIRRSKLAFAELRRADEELSALQGLSTGNISVGVAPIARSTLVPQAIARLLKERPNLSVTVIDGVRDMLYAHLKNGDMDFLVGPTGGLPAAEGLTEEIILHDRHCVIAGAHHPLAAKDKVTVQDFGEYDWILPSINTKPRQLFDEYLAKNRIAFRVPPIVTGSLATIREILVVTDRLAVVSPYRFTYELDSGHVKILAIDLKEIRLTIGIMMRNGVSLSPGAAILLRHVREIAAELSAVGLKAPYAKDH